MVVPHDDSGGTISDGIGKNLAWMYQRGVQRANENCAFGDETSCAIQSQDNKMFLLLVADISELGNYFVGRVQHNRSRGLRRQITAGQFESGKQFTYLRRAHTGDGGECWVIY